MLNNENNLMLQSVGITWNWMEYIPFSCPAEIPLLGILVGGQSLLLGKHGQILPHVTLN